MKNYKLFTESFIKKDDKKDLFSYSGLIKTAWRKLISQAQDFYKISFDLENDDCSGSRRTLYVDKNLRIDQPIKYQFNIEAWKAGGDWEMPVLYFKVELAHDYGVRYVDKRTGEHIFDLEKPEGVFDMHNKHVVIPNIEQGNFLVKTDKGYRAYTDDDLNKEGIKSWKDVKPDESKAWKWIQEYLTNLVDERHVMIDGCVKCKDNDPKSDSDPSDEKPIESDDNEV